MSGKGECGSAAAGRFRRKLAVRYLAESRSRRPEEAMNSGCTRRSLIGLIGSALPLTAFAQQSQSARVKRIGLLTGNETSLTAVFKDELKRLGYVDGESLIIEHRIARPNTLDLPAQAAELAHMGLELIVVAALRPAEEVRKANPAMPMVIATCPGMVANGFAKSLDHPGGNVTGMDELPPGVTAKRLALLKTAAPSVSRVALLSTTPGCGGHEAQLANAEQTATTLGVEVKPYRATSLRELEAGLAALADDEMDGLLNFQGALSLFNRKLIVDFAAKHNIPAIYQATLFAEAGGLMTWAPDLNEQFRIAAHNVDQILRGAKPGDLPIRYPPRYFLTINAGTAKILGLILPEALLAQADRVLS
jgi:putative ABC transport system substrate-binding protein